MEHPTDIREESVNDQDENNQPISNTSQTLQMPVCSEECWDAESTNSPFRLEESTQQYPSHPCRIPTNTNQISDQIQVPFQSSNGQSSSNFVAANNLLTKKISLPPVVSIPKPFATSNTTYTNTNAASTSFPASSTRHFTVPQDADAQRPLSSGETPSWPHGESELSSFLTSMKFSL